MNEIKTGKIVLVIAGKESGRAFAVIERSDNRFALIADGRHRKIEKPKRKNVRHLIVLSQDGKAAYLSEEALKNLSEGKLTNNHLKRELKMYV